MCIKYILCRRKLELRIFPLKKNTYIGALLLFFACFHSFKRPISVMYALHHSLQIDSFQHFYPFFIFVSRNYLQKFFLRSAKSIRYLQISAVSIVLQVSLLYRQYITLTLSCAKDVLGGLGYTCNAWSTNKVVNITIRFVYTIYKV